MTPVFSFHRGTTPLLVSIPHDGRALMPGQPERMTEAGLSIPDTDWHVGELYAFTRELGASTLQANYSRYVVDLNRPADNGEMYAGQISTGLCPAQTFAGDAIYRSGTEIAEDECRQRVEEYWSPYHKKLEMTLRELRSKFGYALLWDAHSIASQVPRLFTGVLSDLNVGTNGGASCTPGCETDVMSAASASKFSVVSNERFKGGYITRHYGKPDQDFYAIQLELSQRCYMNESDLRYDAGLATGAREAIRNMLIAFMAAPEKLR